MRGRLAKQLKWVKIIPSNMRGLITNLMSDLFRDQTTFGWRGLFEMKEAFLFTERIIQIYTYTKIINTT